MQKGTSSTAGGHFKVEIRGCPSASLGQPRCVFRGMTWSMTLGCKPAGIGRAFFLGGLDEVSITRG